jgi:hypothetical protein
MPKTAALPTPASEILEAAIYVSRDLNKEPTCVQNWYSTTYVSETVKAAIDVCRTIPK